MRAVERVVRWIVECSRVVVERESMRRREGRVSSLPFPSRRALPFLLCRNSATHILDPRLPIRSSLHRRITALAQMTLPLQPILVDAPRSIPRVYGVGVESLPIGAGGACGGGSSVVL